MKLRRSLLLVPAAVAAAAFAGASAQSAPPAAKPRLAAFDSCGQLLDYAKGQAQRFVGPYGFGGRGIAIEKGATPPAAPTSSAATPAAGVDYSGTNVQEEGVDEPDMVKTDGKTLFVVSGGKLHSVDASGAKPRRLDTLQLDGGWNHELLLHGDRLLVLTQSGYWIQPMPALARVIAPYQPARSVLTEIDVSNPEQLKLVRTLELDGSYVAARLVGSTVRIVSSAMIPAALPFVAPADGSPEAVAAATAKNRAIFADSEAASWLPSYRTKPAGGTAGEARPLVQCRHVRRTSSFSGLGLLTVLTIDLAKGLELVDSDGILTDGRIVYASPESLYVTTERWADRPDPTKPMVPQDGVRTEIHKFDISNPVDTQYRGSGSVSGYLLNQWSLSEHEGVLRVVSTETPAWWGPQAAEPESFLTTLRAGGGVLRQVGRVGGLGKGERVYSVRFVGDNAYVVTFRQVDPLYTIDVSDPERPRVLGELKIPGYSAYLHPIGEDLLLGVGQDVNEQGWRRGTQISIFDVSDLRKPTRLHTLHLGAGGSEAEDNHHAFLFWPRTGLVVIPFNERAVGFRVGRTRGIDQLGQIDHERALPIRRSVVVGDGVFTVSLNGVKESSLTTLAERGWAAFPVPVVPPPPVGIPALPPPSP